jgi:hypothetical protein
MRNGSAARFLAHGGLPSRPVRPNVSLALEEVSLALEEA